MDNPAKAAADMNQPDKAKSPTEAMTANHPKKMPIPIQRQCGRNRRIKGIRFLSIFFIVTTPGFITPEALSLLTAYRSLLP